MTEVLYHQERIINLLWSYIERKDEHSLQSLLDLVTHFAHDLGPDFEPYFGKTLTILIELAHDRNIEVVEWTFNCLAYLFKYLSRLLTSNLKPTFDVLSPLFGKESHQKHYVLRFAAESMAFLLRKCSSESYKDIVDHILNDVANSPNNEYITSVATLFADAMKNPGNTLHSKTESMLSELLRASTSFESESQQHSHSSDLAVTVFYHLVEHSSKEAAGTLVALTSKIVDTAETPAERELGARLTIGLATVQKGSKVAEWPRIFELLFSIIHIAPDNQDANNTYLFQCALSLAQNADFQTHTKYMPELLGVIVKDSRINSLAFMSAYLKLNKASFTNHAIPFVRDCVKEYASKDFKSICILLIDLHRNGLLSKNPIGSSILCVSKIAPFTSAVRRALSSTSPIEQWLALEMYSIALEIGTKVEKDDIERQYRALIEKDRSDGVYRPALLGKILSAMASGSMSVDYANLLPSITELALYGPFLNGLRDIIVTCPPSCADDKLNVAQSTWPAVSSHSHEVRETALEILQNLHPSTLLDECMAIEKTPLTMTNGRSIMISVRRLGTNFASHGLNKVLDNTVPRYLFALLGVRFQPIWDTASEAIVTIAGKGKTIQDLIWKLAFEWIEKTVSFHQFSNHTAVGSNGTTESLAFQDFAYTKFVGLSTESEIKFSNSHQTVEDLVVESLSPPEVPSFLRLHALKVLKNLPQVAESHVNELVPFLLQDIMDSEEESTETKIWKNEDRVALLEVFASIPNLKSVRESEDIHKQFLQLLANRNADIQKLALKCVLTFERAARKYRDRLENLFDDSVFRDELSKFVLHPSEEGSILVAEDQSTVIPIVIRILFGKVQTSKKTGNKSASRFAIVNSLASLDSQYLNMFVEIAAERLDHSRFLILGPNKEYTINPEFQDNPSHMLKREVAFTSTLEDLASALRDKCSMAIEIILESLFLSLYRGYSDLSSDAMDVDDDSSDNEFQQKMSKAVRQTGMKCLTLLLKYLSDASIWQQYFTVLYENFLKPRLAFFGNYVVQGPMRLILTLSSSLELATNLTRDNSAMIATLFKLIELEDTSDSIVELIMDVLLNLFKLPEGHVKKQLLSVGMPIVLPHMPTILSRQEIPPALLEKEAEVLSELVQLQDIDLDTRVNLIKVCLAAVNRPSQIIRIPVKVSLLKAMPRLFESESVSKDLVFRAFEDLARIFRQIPQKDVRVGLAELYKSFGDRFPELSRSGALLVELNSYSTKRMGLIDFDRRLPAFAQITEELYASLSGLEWVPLLNSMLFFMKDPEEHALRTNACYAVQRFIEAIRLQQDPSKHIDTVEQVLVPVIKHNLRETNKIFREEFIEVLHELVVSGSYAPVVDMQALLLLGDESNIFINLLHLQSHRRARAIRRLGRVVEQDKITSYNIFHYLLPIVEHDIDAEYSVDVIRTMSQMASRLSWSHYRNYIRKFVAGLGDKEKLRTSVKLIDAMADSLYEQSDNSQDQVVDEADEDIVKTMEAHEEELESKPGCRLVVDQQELSDFLLKQVIAPATASLQRRNQDESLPKRLPLAVALTKFLSLLPEETIAIKLPGILTSVCHMLRTKAVELRDDVRKVLGKIVVVLGPKYIRRIILELKAALFKGLQLHILGYTLHSLLVSARKILKPGDLDDAARLISEIIMEDTFGRVGAAKDDEDYKSEVREVKQFKSFDSAEILAKFVSLGSFTEILYPVRELLLTQKMTIKKERKMEEFLRRVSVGMFQNASADPQSVIVMSYQIFADVQKEQNRKVKGKSTEDSEDGNDPTVSGRVQAMKEQKEGQEEHFTVVLDSRHWGQNHFPSNLHLVSKFALETVRSVMAKNEEVCTAENVLGLIPILEGTIRDRNEPIQVETLRLLILFTTRHPSVVADKMGYFGDYILEFVRDNVNTNTLICQMSLKLLSLMLRKSQALGADIADVQVLTDDGLAYILTRIKSDLEEPNLQSIATSIIKAVLSRKLMVPEVYDVMGHVAQVMVTNHVRATRDSCRSAYIQFLTNYPHSAKSIKKELKFLAGNLSYPSPTGRISVMEVIHELVTKVNEATIEESYPTFFVALVLVLVNDESKECREAAAMLIREIMDHDSQIPGIEEYLIKWLDVSTNEPVLRGALQVTGIYLEKAGTKNRTIRQALNRILLHILQHSSAEESGVQVSWQTVYMGLQVLLKATEQIGMDTELVRLTVDSVLYPHPWVRLAASRLMGVYFSHNIDTDLGQAAYRLIRQLGAPDLGQELAVQTTKNIVYILRQWAENGNICTVDVEENDELEQESSSSSKRDIQWMTRRCSYLLRDEKFTQMSKKASIQLLASIIQILPEDSVTTLSHDIIEALFYYSTTEIEKYGELKNLCIEALGMLQKKIGVALYVQKYTNVQQEFSERRQERKQKRAIEAVADPELHARKKQKKNELKRRKRREENSKRRIVNSR